MYTTVIESTQAILADRRMRWCLDRAGSTSGWTPTNRGSRTRPCLRSANDVPMLVERAMWWPGGFDAWFEGHNSRGAIETGEKWGLADGEVGGPLGLETHVWWPTRRRLRPRCR